MIFKNINSEDISGLIICSEPPISSSAIRTKETTIDGRDGAIVEKLGYKTRIRNVEIGLKKDANVDKILSYFSGEGDLIFKNENDKVYKAAIYEQVDLERLLRLRKGSVAFYCQPFKYKRNDIFETIKDNKVKEKKGKHLELLNCAEQNVVDLKLEGSTTQSTRSGKNKLPYNYYDGNSKTVNGITFTVNKDRSITANGTATANATFGMVDINSYAITAGSYKLVGENSEYTKTAIRGSYKKADGTTKYVSSVSDFTIEEGSTNVYFYVAILQGETVNNVTFYPMLLKLTETDLTFEAGGASPSPDYPSPIENVEGKNKFDINQEKEIFGIMLYKYSYYLKPNTKYTISSNCPASTTANIYANSNSSNSAVYINKNQTIQSDENGYFYILVRFKADASDNSTFNLYEKVLSGTYYIQLEEGTVATPYIPDNSLEIKDIGGNLLKNSSFTENLKDWDVVRTDNTTLSISEIFNKKCLHIKGGLNKGQYIKQSIQNRIQVGNKYTISCKAYLKDFVSGTTNPICAFYLDGVGIDGKWIGPTYSGGQNFSDTKYNYSQGFIEVKTTITINKNTDLTKTFAMFVCARDFTGDLYIYDLQLEEGTEASPYKPYKEQKVVFPLSYGQKLMKGSYLANDGIHNKRKQYVITGNETIEKIWIDDDTHHVFAIKASLPVPQISDKTYKEYLCNTYRVLNYDGGIDSIWANRKDNNTNYTTAMAIDYANSSLSMRGRIIIKDMSIDDIDKMKTYLSEQYSNGTPVIVEYELASEEIVPYTTEQQEAYNQLQKLKLYKGQNTMFSLEGSIINLKYLEDTDEKVENQGNIYSKPIIRLEKTVFKEVEIAINGIRFKYNFEEDDYVEIDCEEMTVQYEGLDRNRRLVIDFEFPKLKEGNNDIVMYSGDCIIKCKRKDRWL